jgi:hypothetical protein
MFAGLALGAGAGDFSMSMYANVAPTAAKGEATNTANGIR